MAGTSDETRERLRSAMERLQALLMDVTGDVVTRIHERCPYRARGDRCTFSGGCRNQRRAADAPVRILRCGGDHALRRANP